MVSKRVWLGLLCIAVLVGAVGGTLIGIFIGNRISTLESRVNSLQENVSSLENVRDSLQNNVSTLESQVEELQDEVDRLLDELGHVNSTKSFVFEWPPWEQTIVNGTLRMELTFSWQGENLSIIVKINDDEYSEWDCLALAFDFDGDGTPDFGLNLYANGYKHPGILASNNRIEDPFLYAPTPSEYHTCVFEPEIGYTFNILFPPLDETPLTELPTDSMFVRFEDTASHGVYVYFQFGLLEEP